MITHILAKRDCDTSWHRALEVAPGYPQSQILDLVEQMKGVWPDVEFSTLSNCELHKTKPNNFTDDKGYSVVVGGTPRRKVPAQ